jgi:hypothetical protein
MFFSKRSPNTLNILRHNTLYNKVTEVTMWTEPISYHAKKMILAPVKDAQKQIAHQNISLSLNLKQFTARSNGSV